LSHQAAYLAVLVFCGTWLVSGFARLGSYPLPVLFTALGVAGLLLARLLVRLWQLRAGPAWNRRQRTLAVFAAALGMVLAGRAGLALTASLLAPRLQ